MSRHRHTWTPADEAIVHAEYGRTPTRDIASRIGVTTTAVRQRALKLGLRFAPVWTPERLQCNRKTASSAMSRLAARRLIEPTRTEIVPNTSAMGGTFKRIYYRWKD